TSRSSSSSASIRSGRNSFNLCPTSRSAPASIASHRDGDRTSTSSFRAGCERLNIRIRGGEDIYNEARGDYWLTQQMCQSICTGANVLETQENQTEVTFSLADLRARVVDKLRSNYYPAVKEFCRGRRFRPSNDPYFKLLHAVGQQNSSIVDLNEMANALPDVRGSINNIKLISSKPGVANQFYYNTETKSFAKWLSILLLVEQPQCSVSMPIQC